MLEAADAQGKEPRVLFETIVFSILSPKLNSKTPRWTQGQETE